MLMNRFITLFLLSTGIAFAQERAWTEEEETTEYWYEQGRIELKEALRRQDLNKNVARNVILFLGDGMGIPSITAGRILKGQLKNASGEETVLAMDQFPHAGLSKTYAVDKDVTDSAASATAYLCGVKTNYHTIGVSGMTSVGNCTSSVGNHVDSVLVDAYKAGKSTGIVTTAHITHATPAGTYAHVADRDWYADDDLTEEAKANGCKDIARQFYEESDKITVGLGGGRKYFMLEDQVDPEYPRDTPNREDGLDLIQMWKDKHGENAKYVWNATAFNDVNPITTDKLFGLFEPSHMQYEADRALDPAGEPSIAEMTEKAIRILQKNTKGFFLLVEGGRIDHGHHATNAHRALRELVAMDEAIEKAVELTAESDTLIVVTADHSHTFNMGGYSVRGNPILGLAPDHNDPEMALDDKPYTTLLYGNGPGYQGSSGAVKNQRTNLTEVDTQAKSYMQQTSGPKESETHGGEDVAILARGPMAHLFHGVHEESYIAYVMRYASCTGDNQGHCSGDDDDDDVMPATEGASGLIVATFVGMELNREQAAIALNSQFVILLCLLLFWVLWFIVICQRARNRCRRKGCSLDSTPQLEMKTAYENNID